jgi:hypothetical protein
MSQGPIPSRAEGAGLFCLFLLAAASACHNGTTATPLPPAPDVRFRAVGFAQVPVFAVGVTGGPMPGLGAEEVWWRGTGYVAWGLAISDAMSIHGTRVAGDERVRYVRQWWNGRDCPTSLDAALASNSVVLGIGGDPHALDATCTLFGVGPDDTDPVKYEYLVGASRSAAEIEAALDADEKARSFVVTAITRIADDRYTFVAESVGAVDGQYEQFQTAVRRAPLGELATVAEALASNGYVITASSWEGEAEYTLVGTRNASDARARSVQVLLSDAGRFTEDVGALLAGGYSPVSVTMGRVNEQFIIPVIGER